MLMTDKVNIVGATLTRQPFWEPTVLLRFVERVENHFGDAKQVRVLQQTWWDRGSGDTQWRDVPLEKEE